MVKTNPVRILAIETSCDETASAIIENGRRILSSVVASQVDIHIRFGGVFPEVASRQHILAVIPVIKQTLSEAHLSLLDIDAIAVTRGPGLTGSLIVGINTAKGLCLGTGKPIIGVNHLEGHVYSTWLHHSDIKPPPEPQFPLLALIVSGGHTELNLIRGHLDYQRLGGTLDDAAGEAFDKVARLIGLGYPGGPAIQSASEAGDKTRFSFPRAWLEGSWDFSFSGLKTAVLNSVNKKKQTAEELPVSDIAAAFQDSVVDILYTKSMNAAREFKVKEIIVVGGVSANNALREAFTSQSQFSVTIPPLQLCTDNAAMIAAAGYFRYKSGQRDELTMDALSTWPLS